MIASMERPLSAASSTTVPSTTFRAIPNRHASIRHTTKSTGSAVIPLFVANLRLLDLDRLPDWPTITTASFGNHDARNRIKCIEYALYQLFRLYDPHATADKLQPFFPPLEPLQSVNLRAALHRCLNELKKNGVLPKDIALRKSMLDDCQGEKFWEVCLAFSAIALRRVTLEHKSKYGRPLAEKIGTAKTVNKVQRDGMLPLAIAHKAALSKVLRERTSKRETYLRLHDVLREKEQELKQRKAKSLEKSQKAKILPPEKARGVGNAIENSWVGSSELKDALVNGDTCAKGDGVLVESFDQLWKQDVGLELTVSNGADVGLLQSLSSRATQQSVRLRMWQTYLDRLIATKPNPRNSRLDLDSQKPTPRFDRHQQLALDKTISVEDQPSPLRATRRSYTNALRYDETLTAMRQELRKNSAHCDGAHRAQQSISPLKRSQTQPIPLRKPSIAVDTSPCAQDLHARSPSQTAVPMRPRMGRRVSSQSKPYEKPKVESQREPIPLKADLFSPLKENRRSTPSLTFAAPVLVETDEEKDPENGVPITVSDAEKNRSKDDADSGIVMPSRHETGANSSSESQAASTRSSVSIPDEVSEPIKSDAQFKVPALPTKRDALRPSLIERTRMSIAFNSSEDINKLLPEPVTTGAKEQSHKDREMAIADGTPTFDRRSSLIERTRESMSTAPELLISKKPSHRRSRSSLYPVNQFATPRKSRSSTVGHRDATPIEQLLSPEAEYDSVFKSRPKIALSPVLSPRGDAEMAGILGNDVASASPLANVGSQT